MADDRAFETVEALVAQRRLRRLSEPNWPDARDRCRQAHAHLTSIEKIVDDDPTLAMAALHAAARKVLTAHMEAHALRPENAPGAHRAVMAYARDRLRDDVTTDELDVLEGVLAARNQAEYGTGLATRPTPARVREGLAHVRSVVVKVTALVAAADRAAHRRS